MRVLYSFQPLSSYLSRDATFSTILAIRARRGDLLLAEQLERGIWGIVGVLCQGTLVIEQPLQLFGQVAHLAVVVIGEGLPTRQLSID